MRYAHLLFTAAEPDAAAWRLVLLLALRRGELGGLTWSATNLEARTLEIRQTIINDGHGRPVVSVPKTPGSRRTLDFDATSAAALKSHRRRQLEERLALGIRRDYDLVFAQPDREPFPPGWWTRRWAALVKRSGLPRIRLHDARHTWASLALAQGVHVKVVQERLGHSSPMQTLATYSHVSPGLGRQAGEQIAALVDGLQ
jgi:integrase